MVRSRTGATVGMACLLALAVSQAGCALLIPPSWRARAPVPLAGEIPPASSSRAISEDELARLSDDELVSQIERDRDRLIVLASQSGQGPVATSASEQEMREIAQRLPVLQREIERRGTPQAGSRIRHPVIR